MLQVRLLIIVSKATIFAFKCRVSFFLLLLSPSFLFNLLGIFLFLRLMDSQMIVKW